MAKRTRKTVTLTCKFGTARKAGKRTTRKAGKASSSRKLSCKKGTFKMKKLGRAGKRCTCINTGGNRVIVKTKRCAGKK